MLNIVARPRRNDCRPTRRDNEKAGSCPEFLGENKDKSRTQSDEWCRCRPLFRPECFRTFRIVLSCLSRRVWCDGAFERRWRWCRACSRAPTWCRPHEWRSTRVAKPEVVKKTNTFSIGHFNSSLWHIFCYLTFTKIGDRNNLIYPSALE